MGYRHAAVLSAVGFLLGVHGHSNWEHLATNDSLLSIFLRSSSSISSCLSSCFAWMRWHNQASFSSASTPTTVFYGSLSPTRLSMTPSTIIPLSTMRQKLFRLVIGPVRARTSDLRLSSPHATFYSPSISLLTECISTLSPTPESLAWRCRNWRRGAHRKTSQMG
jgi:hypothetical protein